MNLSGSAFLLSAETEYFLRVLYRQSKITNRVQINFLAAVLGVSVQNASETAKLLHEIGFVRYEKYGRISWTTCGLRYGESLIQKEREILEKR